jgi:hypothetical protein
MDKEMKMMRVTKFRRGDYIVTLHGCSFTIRNDEGSWGLYTVKDIEINRSTTKSGMLEVMRNWSPERAKQESKLGTDW